MYGYLGVLNAVVKQKYMALKYNKKVFKGK